MPGPQPAVALGATVGPFPTALDADVVRAFAYATGDREPAATAGAVVPPAALAARIWEAQEQARPVLVDAGLQSSATGGVHGEHDIVVHRPPVPGEPLAISVEGHGARPAGRNALVTLRYLSRDLDGHLVAEQWWTTVYLGVTCAPVGEAPPGHAFPEAARQRLLATTTTHVDDDMARRYAEVSGDWSDHHFDADAARRSGAPAPFLHGLCTMALCARAVTELVAEGDPAHVRRVAVRFAAPMPLGEQLRVDVFDAGDGSFAFEATGGDRPVVTNGLLALRA